MQIKIQKGIPHHPRTVWAYLRNNYGLKSGNKVLSTGPFPLVKRGNNEFMARQYSGRKIYFNYHDAEGNAAFDFSYDPLIVKRDGFYYSARPKGIGLDHPYLTNGHPYLIQWSEGPLFTIFSDRGSFLICSFKGRNHFDQDLAYWAISRRKTI